LDLVVVYGIEPHSVEAVPGKKSRVMIGHDRFQHFSQQSEDGHYYLRPDRIMAMFVLDDDFEFVKETDEAMFNAECEQDQKVLNTLKRVKYFFCLN
jgi:hypothetical protein